ncbi:MAG: hypothetical protein HY953_02420, partial [Candidatus Rokubacteria bacterium]|nr:hypothetical protein [Candidatus Rokubacteria bacterium]
MAISILSGDKVLPSCCAGARPGSKIVWTLSGLAALFFLVVGAGTPGDIDEGYFALAAQLIVQGKVPYRDFFLPQTPLVPYLFAGLFRLLGPGYLVGRCLGAIFAAATAGLVGLAVHRETRQRLPAVVAVVLFCTHALSWQWLSLIKPYGIGGLLVLASVLLVSHPHRAPSRGACILAGSCAGLAAGCRLLLVPVVLACAVGATLHPAPIARQVTPGVVRPDPPWARALAVLAAAAVVGAAIALPFYLIAPEGFLFGNLGYHALRAPGGLVGGLSGNLVLLLELIGAGQASDCSASGVQFVALLALNLVAVVLPGWRLRVAAWTAIALLVAASVLPNPAYEQYFTPLVPLLAVGAGASLGRLLAALPTVPRRLSLALPLALVTLSVLSGVQGFGKHWVLGLYPWPMADYRPRALDRTAREVADRSARHPGPVLSAWEGSCLYCAPSIMPGYENQFVRGPAEGLAPARRQ